MIKIELREDGWFEAGKDSEKTFPMAHLIYQSKQKIKKALEEIGEQPSREKLEEALAKIKVSKLWEFKGTPYLTGNDILIETHGLPGTCYLGSLIEN